MSAREEVKPAEEENKPVAEPKQEVVSQSKPEPQIVEPKVKEAVVEQEVKDASDKGTKTALYRSRKRITLQTPLSK